MCKCDGNPADVTSMCLADHQLLRVTDQGPSCYIEVHHHLLMTEGIRDTQAARLWTHELLWPLHLAHGLPDGLVEPSLDLPQYRELRARAGCFLPLYFLHSGSDLRQSLTALSVLLQPLLYLLSHRNFLQWNLYTYDSLGWRVQESPPGLPKKGHSTPLPWFSIFLLLFSPFFFF